MHRLQAFAKYKKLYLSRHYIGISKQKKKKNYESRGYLLFLDARGLPYTAL